MANDDKYREKLGLSSDSQKNVTLRARNKTVLLNSNMTSQLRSGALGGQDDASFGAAPQQNIGGDTSWGSPSETQTGGSDAGSGWGRPNIASANESSFGGGQVMDATVSPVNSEAEINAMSSWNRPISGSSSVSKSLDKLVEDEQQSQSFNSGSNNFNSGQSRNEDWGTETVRTIKQSDFDWDKIDAAFDAAEKRQSPEQADGGRYDNNDSYNSANNRVEDWQSSQAQERDYNSPDRYNQGSRQWEEPSPTMIQEEPIAQAGMNRTARSNDSYNDNKFDREVGGSAMNMSRTNNYNNNANDNYYARNSEVKVSQPAANQRLNNNQNFNTKSKEEKMAMDNTRQGFSFNPKNTTSERAVVNNNSGIRPVPRQRKGRIIAFLISFDVDPNGEVYEISAGRWLVTSKPTEHTDYILLEEDTVSPLHAFIRATENGKIQVLDQLSEYGTFVTAPNSEEEEEIAGAMAALEHGSRVRFGNRRFVLAIIPPIA